MSEANQQRPTLRATIQRLLTVHYGGQVELDAGSAPEENDHVWRFHLLTRPAHAPASVIVKQAYADARFKHFFTNEWVGLQFVSAVATKPRVSPRIYAGDWAAELLVIEDLGSGDDLVEVVQGLNKGATEAALLDFATVLGQLHAQTCGQQTAYERIRAAYGLPPQALDTTAYTFPGPPVQPLDDPPYGWLASALYGLTTALDIIPAAGVDQDLAALQAALLTPGPLWALTHGDAPWNVLRNGPTVRLIDFETSAFRPALTEGVVMRMHFPISSCVYQLPRPLLHRTEVAYRTALVSGCPAAADDTLFGRALVEGCAYWALITCRWSTLPTLWCNLPALLAADQRWGTATMRQRLLARLTSAAQATVEFAHLEALGATLDALATHLRQRWPAEAATLPQLPAFQ